MTSKYRAMFENVVGMITEAKDKIYVGGFADPDKADAFASHVEKTGGKVVKREKKPMSWKPGSHTHEVHYTHPKGPTGPHMEVGEKKD